MMREIQEKQEWLSKFLASKKEKKLDFVGKYNVKSNPQVVAADIRKSLGITTNLKADIKPIKHWIDRAENKRIFVSLSSNYHTRLKLDSDLFKGFVISDKYAPFIFLNADDWEHGQLFTLVHELAHIWINVSGISNETAPGAHPQGTHLVEKFCREVAELALLPEEEIKTITPVKGDLTLRNISRASKRLGVSNEKFTLSHWEIRIDPGRKK
jgi:Zn-dependent peptidase ImmA (M78 family)